MTALQFIVNIAIVLIAYILGYVLTEQYPISDKWKGFDQKPFNCRLCLSTHLSWVTSTAVALLWKSLPMLILGIVFAVALFIGLYTEQKRKTIEI